MTSDRASVRSPGPTNLPPSAGHERVALAGSPQGTVGVAAGVAAAEGPEQR